jgi:twitching motility protein PilT
MEPTPTAPPPAEGQTSDPVIDLFVKVLTWSKSQAVSDVHLSVGSPWKYRLHGQMVSIDKIPPLRSPECEAIARHILTSLKTMTAEEVERRVSALQDFDCSYSIPGVARYRVNICRQRGSLSIVLRIIPFVIPTIEELGLPPVVNDIAREERGLILVTGVTGSGKSTTLAAMVGLINNSKPCKIVTIEDPIEFLHRENKASVIQREVGFDTDSFATALRAALRQDPDIILVGEMRDRATIDIALKAAETGHLVLSTLHTEDAPKSVHRVISVFELSEQKTIRLRLAESLRAVISQRLIRKKDSSGRVVCAEVMRNTLAIRDCIENPEKSGNMRDFITQGRDSYGMQTFDQHLMELYQSGMIDMQTAQSAATSAADFERAVHFS